MTVHRRALVSVTLTIRPYPPVGSPETPIVHRFSTQPIADAGDYRGFTQGRVQSFEDVERALSSFEGDYAVSTWGVRLDDHDGLLRGYLADPETNLIEQARWEVSVELISEEGRLDELEPVTLFRGIVTDAVPEVGRGVSLKAKDILGGHLKGFDLDATMPIPTLEQCFSASLVERPDALDTLYPNVVYGENSDHGTEDVGGNIAEKGLVRAKYCGKKLISDGFPGTPPTSPTYLGQVTNLQCNVTGTGPTHRVAIGVSLMTEFGETPPTVLVVDDYPVTPSGSHYAEWTWDLPVAHQDEIKYTVQYVGDRMTYPKYFLDGGGGTPYTPATDYTDDGDDSHTKGYRHGPLKKNTAQVAPGEPGVPGSGPMFWDFFSAGIGVLPWTTVDFYGAVLEGNGTTQRGLLNASTANAGIRNVEIIAPGDSLWPHDDNWVVDDLGQRHSGFYVRGARSVQAINGNVGFALNIGGYTQNPDGTGNLFTTAGECALHCLSNWWGLDPTTPIYTNGTSWNDYPRFANGASKLHVNGFKTFQLDCAAAMFSATGPLFRNVIDQPITLREWLSKFQWTFYGRWGVNHHGQLSPRRTPHGLTETGTLFRDKIEIRRWLTPQFDRKVASEIRYVFDFDSELQEFRREPIPLRNDTLISANDGKPQTRELIEMPMTGDPETARCSAHYWLALFSKPRRFQPFEVSYRGIATDTSDPFRVTHYDGLGADGEIRTQMLCDRHLTQPSSERVVLTGLDLSTVAQPTSYEQEQLPMVASQSLGGSADAGIVSTSYVPIRGRIKINCMASDFTGWTLKLRVQRWIGDSSATVRWRLVDGDGNVLYEDSTSNTTTEYAEPSQLTEGSDFDLPATRKDVFLEAKTSNALVPAFVLGSLVATR